MKRALLALVLALLPLQAQAHGIWGHIHVTGWAIENLPPGELRDLMADPEVRNAALFGAAFTDSGYWPQGGALQAPARAYGEHTHWEPFVNDYIAWMLANDSPPYTTLESKKRAAFLLGAASHGLQDELFDSLFLYQIEKYDGAGQEEADPGTDGFLALDGYIRLIPQEYIPMEVLVGVYAGVDSAITADVIQSAVDVMTLFYVNETRGPALARAQGEMYEAAIPWARQNYLNPDIPGSLHSEVRPTMAYMQAVWDRLNDRPVESVVFAYPETPRRLLGAKAGDPDSWVTFVSSMGLQNGSSVATWEGSTFAPVLFNTLGSRWTGSGWTRIVRLQPTTDLIGGENYEAGLTNAIRVDGSEFKAATHMFQVECNPADPALCPALNIEDPVVLPAEMVPDAGMEPDAGDMGDSTPTDVGVDSGSPEADMGSLDAGKVSVPGQPDDGCSAVGATPWWGASILALLFWRRRN
jgi:hypothetical protein